MDIADYFSESARELLQRAANTAMEWGGREVDTEHLLYALADNEVAQAIFKQLRVAPQDIKSQLEGSARQVPGERRRTDGDRRPVRRGEGAGRRLLDLEGELDGGGDRVGEALPGPRRGAG